METADAEAANSAVLELREKFLGVLAELAPEVDVHALRPDVRLRDQLDLDSVDFLNFLIGIDEQLGVDIPEADYPQLATLDSIYAYLRKKLAESQTRLRAHFSSCRRALLQFERDWGRTSLG